MLLTAESTISDPNPSCSSGTILTLTPYGVLGGGFHPVQPSKPAS
jgi:hypothetical protein